MQQKARFAFAERALGNWLRVRSRAVCEDARWAGQQGEIRQRRVVTPCRLIGFNPEVFSEELKGLVGGKEAFEDTPVEVVRRWPHDASSGGECRWRDNCEFVGLLNGRFFSSSQEFAARAQMFIP